MKRNLHIIIVTILIVWPVIGIMAQRSGPVGVSSIIVNFDQPPDPAQVSVTLAPLKYNKDFALSMQIDDGDTTIFEKGYPVFEGGEVNGTTYPGFTYTDGCTNPHHFKMSSVLYSFNGDNGPDMHVNNAYGQVSWDQLNTMVQSNWGIINHGISGNADTDPDFMNYSIARNQSYIRRQLYETTAGGVVTHLHANPNGSGPWTDAARDLGYLSAYNQNSPSPLGEHGGNVNNPTVDWTQFQNILRVDAGPIDIQQFVSNLADSSVNGANFWGSIFTHSLFVEVQYPFNDFLSDFNYINNTYGSAGLDNILMTSDEEIRDYLLIRDTVEVNYFVNGSTVFIVFNGEVPDNLKFYSISLNITSNTNITGFIVNGTEDYSTNGVGSQKGLININWDGLVVPPAEQLADDYTTIAVNSGLQFDAWIAMDYVTTLEDGLHKDSLRHALCDLGLIYDEGFCSFLTVDLGPDTTICRGNCVPLSGPDDMALYQWYVADTIYDTVQSILACPVDTTQFILYVEDEFGNFASDSAWINVLPSAQINLGNDTTLCLGDSLILSGPTAPEGDVYTYSWSTGDVSQEITIYPTVDLLYFLDVTNNYSCTASDSITILVVALPIIDSIVGDTTTCPGDSVRLEVRGSGIATNTWNNGDTTQIIWAHPTTSDTTYTYIVTVENVSGCQSSDSIKVRVFPKPIVQFEMDTLSLCQGNDTTLELSGSNITSYRWNYQEIDSVTTISELRFIKPQVSAYVYVEGISIDGCSANDSLWLDIMPVPEITISSDTTICSGDSITLFISGGNLFYWIVDTVLVSTDSTFKVAPTDTTTYKVGTAFADSLCYRDTTITVSVFKKPTTQIVYDTNLVCENSKVILHAQGADSYRWLPSETTGSTYAFYISDTTKIFLIGTTTDGCTLTDSLTINTLNVPVVHLSGVYPVYCDTDPPSELTGIPEGGEFFGNGVTDNMFDPQLAGSGIDTVIYALQNNEGCFGYDTIITIVYGGNQTIDLGPADTLLPSEELFLDAGPGFNSYFWTTGSKEQAILINGSDFPPGTYEYKVIALINGCTSSGSVNITFINPDFIDLSGVGIINLFPNPNDGYFTIALPNTYEPQTVRMFSMQGILVFEQHNIKCAEPECWVKIHLPDLTSGLYTIQVISGKEVYTNKVMVRK